MGWGTDLPPSLNKGPEFGFVFAVVASLPLESVILELAREAAGIASRGHREAEWESPAFSSHG